LWRVILLFLCLFFTNGKTTFSQPDSLWSLPREKQLAAFLKWYYSDLILKDSQLVVTSLATAEKRFAEKDNTLLRRQAWLIRQGYIAGKNADPKMRPVAMLAAADEAAEKDWPLTQAECWHFAGSFYYTEGNYTMAFEYMQKAQAAIEKYNKEQDRFFLKRYSNVLANCYYHFGEYREAIVHLKKTLELPDYWHTVIFSPGVYNTLALCYQNLKQYDSAAIWYNKSFEAAVAFNDSSYMALAQGNLGFTYYLQQQYDKALPLLEADYTGSMRAGQTESAINAAITIAAIYIKKRQLEAARRYLELSRNHVYSNPNAVLLLNWYESLYQLAKATNNNSAIGLYADSLLIYQDSVARMRDRKAFNQAVLKLETEKHMNEVSQLENRRKQQILLRNSLIAGLVLLTLIVMLWLNRQLLKRKKEKELTQQQLVFAEQELIGYTRQLKEKNDLLEQLRDEINKENLITDRDGNINRLLEATIVTEDDWKKFRQLFEKVHPGFFIRLKEKMPDLSPADTRLLALTKLQLPPKDMASMLGVSYDAVKKARQRLRRKINLPEEGSLEELVEMISH
jgi:tetratricopeptide (TPR) repeat protein